MFLFIPYLIVNSFRILIKTGLLIYDFMRFNRNEGDDGPPPLTTNYLAMLNKLADGEPSDPVILASKVHASKAIFISVEKDLIEELYIKASAILKNLKDYKTKNSPLYGQLVEGLWTSFPDMVFLSLASTFFFIYN